MDQFNLITKNTPLRTRINLTYEADKLAIQLIKKQFKVIPELFNVLLLEDAIALNCVNLLNYYLKISAKQVRNFKLDLVFQRAKLLIKVLELNPDLRNDLIFVDPNLDYDQEISLKFIKNPNNFARLVQTLSSPVNTEDFLAFEKFHHRCGQLIGSDYRSPYYLPFSLSLLDPDHNLSTLFMNVKHYTYIDTQSEILSYLVSKGFDFSLINDKKKIKFLSNLVGTFSGVLYPVSAHYCYKNVVDKLEEIIQTIPKQILYELTKKSGGNFSTYHSLYHEIMKLVPDNYELDAHIFLGFCQKRNPSESFLEYFIKKFKPGTEVFLNDLKKHMMKRYNEYRLETVSAFIKDNSVDDPEFIERFIELRSYALEYALSGETSNDLGKCAVKQAEIIAQLIDYNSPLFRSKLLSIQLDHKLTCEILDMRSVELTQNLLLNQTFEWSEVVQQKLIYYFGLPEFILFIAQNKEKIICYPLFYDFMAKFNKKSQSEIKEHTEITYPMAEKWADEWFGKYMTCYSSSVSFSWSYPQPRALRLSHLEKILNRSDHFKKLKKIVKKGLIVCIDDDGELFHQFMALIRKRLPELAGPFLSCKLMDRN